MRTADGYEVKPEIEKLYSYPDFATDGIPSYGLADFDNDSREWHSVHGKHLSLFKTRPAIIKHIEIKTIVAEQLVQDH